MFSENEILVEDEFIEENIPEEAEIFQPNSDEELLKNDSSYVHLSVESIFNEEHLKFQKSDLNLHDVLYDKNYPARKSQIQFTEDGKKYECKVSYLSKDPLDLNFNNALLEIFKKDDENTEIQIFDNVMLKDSRISFVDCNFDGCDDIVYVSEDNMNGEEFCIYFWNKNQEKFDDHILSLVAPDFSKEKLIVREVIKIEENETDYVYRKWNGMTYEFACKVNWKEYAGSDYLNISFTDDANLVLSENTGDLILSWYEKDEVEHIAIPKNYLELPKEEKDSLQKSYLAIMEKIPE